MCMRMRMVGETTEEMQIMNALEYHGWEFGLFSIGAMAVLENLMPDIDMIRFVL